MSKVRSAPKLTAYESDSDLRRGPWTLEEDNLLIHCITCHGEGRWNSLAKFAGLKRTGKSCRLRWLNYLKPDIKRGNLTPHEQLLILELHSKWGNRWSKIAQNLPGRTDNEIKNYWRTRVQKQARQLKVDSNSQKFLEAIRTFWMPRLMEKVDQNASSMTSSPSSSISASENPNCSIITAAPAVNNSDSKFLESCPYLQPQLPEDLTAGKIQGENPVGGNHYYHVGFPSYDVQGLGGQSAAFSECHVAGMDWFGEDLGSTFWNTDELWKSDEVDL